MEYWIVYTIKHKKFYYVSEVEKDGSLKYTKEEKEAKRFRFFGEAMDIFYSKNSHVVSKRYA